MVIPLVLRGAFTSIMLIGIGVSASVGAMYGYNKYNDTQKNKISLKDEEMESSYVIYNEQVSIKDYIEPHKDLQDN